MWNSRLVRNELTGLADRLKPWPDVEQSLSDIVQTKVYLGGDGLRPYASWIDDDGSARIIGVQSVKLPRPPLIDELTDGGYGLPVLSVEPADERVYSLTLSATDQLKSRLDLPHVLLVGLGDAERYRGARLALGIARLCQWLRFTHAAEVAVVDYNLESDPLRLVADHLAQHHVDVVGVSVNFGQWQMLEGLASEVNKCRPSAVVLGNILAAFSPERAMGMFDAENSGTVFVASSLGERPLEELCRRINKPDTWGEINGFLREKRTTAAGTTRRPLPPDVVFPDDSLILAIAQRGGQISLESSFGCQYGVCTFCPRDHRGDGWERGSRAVVEAMIERASLSGAVISLVDEEFFGSEGLIDPPPENIAAATILRTLRRSRSSYEIYTRLEQLFDRRRSLEWNLRRAELLAGETEFMRRIFVGVESGSPTQLRRYGKGQTVGQTVDSLRVASTLGIPLEFGFITFDPLLTPDELVENITFLGRRDIMASPMPGDVAVKVDWVRRHLVEACFEGSGVPLYQHVAYMATELEVLMHSRYADHLRRRHPQLFDGSYDASFARYGVRYADPRIDAVAGWCRVWTEGMFAPVYEARMAARAAGTPDAAVSAKSLVWCYRGATFNLLVSLTARFLPETAGAIQHFLPDGQPIGDSEEEMLRRLAATIVGDDVRPDFDLGVRHHRRDR